MTDPETIRAMRSPKRSPREPHRSFMTPHEFLRLRKEVIRTTQGALAAEMVRPDTGEPTTKFTICRWERGHLAIPLWAARRIRAIALVAQHHDMRQGDDGYL